MNSNILLLLVVLLSASQISASCFFNPAPTALPADKPVVCTDSDGQTYYPGQSWETDYCMKCNCEASGAFRCCGFGLSAGVIHFVGCKIEQIDCLNGVLRDDGEPGSCAEAGKRIHA